MKRRTKKILLSVLAALFAFLTAFEGPMQVIGYCVTLQEEKEALAEVLESNSYITKYISDIKIGTYDALIEDGYMVDQESASNRYFDEDGELQYQGNKSSINGNGVCIGYKVTDDIDDAIYDISVMDMYGGFSELTYRELLAEQQKDMSEFAERIQAVAEVYAEKYDDGDSYAEAACETLNFMTIDVEDDKGTEYEFPLGTFLAGKSKIEPDAEDYLDIVFLCSTVTTSFIYSQLCLAVFDNLNEKGATSWIDRLCNNGPLLFYDDDGSVIEDDGVLNALYEDGGYDTDYLASAKELYHAITEFIDCYREAMSRNANGVVEETITPEDVETAQEVNEGQVVDEFGETPDFTEEEEAKADAVNDAVYIALFNKLDETYEEVTEPEKGELDQYLADLEYETLGEYLAYLKKALETAELTTKEYNSEMTKLNRKSHDAFAEVFEENDCGSLREYVALLDTGLENGEITESEYNEKIATLDGLKKSALTEYLEDSGYETLEDYLADLECMLEDGDLTQAEYDAEVEYLDSIRGGVSTKKAVYPFGKDENGNDITLAQFLYEVGTTDEKNLKYTNDLYRPLYPLLMEQEGPAPLDETQATMFYVSGFYNALSYGLAAVDTKEVSKECREQIASIKESTGLSSLSIWYDVDATLLKSLDEGTGVYWTNKAARITAAKSRYDFLTKPAETSEELTASDVLQKGITYLSLISSVAGGIGGIITNLVSAFASGFYSGVTCQSVVFACLAGKAVTVSTCSVVLSFVGTILTTVAQIATILLILFTIVKFLVELFEVQEIEDLEYLDIPDCIYDYCDVVVGEGAATKYYPVEVTQSDLDDGTVESPDAISDSNPKGNNIYSFYENNRWLPWVCLYYTKDSAAATEPITVLYDGDEKVTIPFVSYVSGYFFDDNDIDILDGTLNSADIYRDKDMIRLIFTGEVMTGVGRYEYADICEYEGSAIENIQGCEPNSDLDGGEGYTPIHGFDELTGYDFAYYKENEWPSDDKDLLLKVGNLATTIKWYMHRSSDYNQYGTDNKYLADVILKSNTKAELAKSEIIASGYELINIDLTPDSELCTYIGYGTTVNASDAITDLRFAYASGQDEKSGKISYGGATYGACGAVGDLILFETTADTAGTPIVMYGPTDDEHPEGEKGSGLLVSYELRTQVDGYEPVNLFCGGPALNINGGGDWCISYEGSEEVYSNKEQITLDHTGIYLYFYPEITYTDTSEENQYIGGLSFFSGRYNGSDDEITQYLKDTGWSLFSDIDVSGHTYVMNINKTFLAYSITYNPYRAIYGITQYTADNTADSMVYCISAGSAGGYCVCDVFQMGGEGFLHWFERSIRQSHAYRTGSYWDGALTEGYTTEPWYGSGGYNSSVVDGFYREAVTLSDDYSIAFRQVTKAGLYVTGNKTEDISKAEPIKYSELRASSSPDYDSETTTPVRAITDWYAEEPVNLGYVSQYNSDAEKIIKDNYEELDSVIEEDNIRNPDGTNIEDNYDDGWYDIDEDLVDDGYYNLYKNEQLYLFINRPSTSRPVFVNGVKVAYAGDNGFTGLTEEEAEKYNYDEDDIAEIYRQDLLSRTPIDEVITELVANGPGELIRINLTGIACDDDTDYENSYVDSFTKTTHSRLDKKAYSFDMYPYDLQIGDWNDEDESYLEHDSLWYNIPVMKKWRSDEVAYVWVTYTNSTISNLSDIRIYECDEETYEENGVPDKITIDTGSKATKCGDSFQYNGEGSYYTLYEVRSLSNYITDIIIDDNVFTRDYWTASSTEGKASSYQHLYFHMKQYIDPFAKNYVSISSFVTSYQNTETAAQLDLLDHGCRVIYPVNLKKAEGSALYLGYKLTSSYKSAISGILLQNNGQDDTVDSLVIGYEKYQKVLETLNPNFYDSIVSIYGTTSRQKALENGSKSGRYVTGVIFWSDPDFWKLFQTEGSDEEQMEKNVEQYLATLDTADREYLEYYLYTTVAGKKTLLRYSPVTDVHGNIYNTNTSWMNFLSDKPIGDEVYMFVRYSDNTVTEPKNLAGSLFSNDSSVWIIVGTAALLSATAATAIVVKKRRKTKADAQ